MVDVQITRNNDIFKYDPAVDGYSDGDLFKKVEGAGTPAISSGKLRLNAVGIISMESFKNCGLSINMLIPTAPTAGDSRVWGFKSYNDGDMGRCEFVIADAAFTAKVYDRAGTLIGSKTINWNSDWTNTAARYRINISESNVFFYINDVAVARFQDGIGREITAGVKLRKFPVEIHINNANSDNVDITSISVV